jgi:uncharacterized protein YcbX
MLHHQTDKIFIYPIKSVGSVKLNAIQLSERGLQYDRNWMLVNDEGNMISQREFPQLNKIRCSDEGNEFKLQLSDSSFPEILFNKSDELYEEIHVKLWGSEFVAYKTQNELTEWFSEYLNHKIHIVTQPARFKQLQNFTNASLMNFQDGSPIHLINIKSVQDLSARCGFALDPMQFRANIYLDLETPYYEDSLKQITINGIEFKFVKSCERCIMINLRPFEDIFGKEPLMSLSKYRKEDHKVHFGIYIAATNTTA